jgi:hypothetical protein
LPDYKAGTGLSDLDILFLKHSYLATLARFLVWAYTFEGKTTEPLSCVAASILSGDYLSAIAWLIWLKTISSIG